MNSEDIKKDSDKNNLSDVYDYDIQDHVESGTRESLVSDDCLSIL